MLRYRLLVSAVPLLLVALVVRPDPRICIASGTTTLALATDPWTADLQLTFTDDAARATVRVLVADGAERADFAIIDDVVDAGGTACAAANRTVAIVGSDAAAPAIQLVRDGPADYSIFVQSRRFGEREAAALIVGARRDARRLALASPQAF